MTHRARWLALTLLVLVPLSAYAHAVVSPAVSRPGAYERYVLRVPNESDNATVRIEMRFPADVRVISFVDVPGWRLEAVMDGTGRAVSAVWTGSLPPERFVELPFMAVNPPGGGRITWPVTQTYANGDRIEWSGPADSDRPASVTELQTSKAWMSVPGLLAFGAVALSAAALAMAMAMARRK